MKYYTIQPSRQLAEYIQFFWVLEGSATPEKPFVHRVLAEPSTEWIFYCKGQFKVYGTFSQSENTYLSAISGPMQNFKKLYTVKDFCLFGVCLFPYAIPTIFGLPACELSDRGADTETLLNKEGRLLEQKIYEAADHQQRAKLISQFMLNRLAKSRETKNPVFDSIRQILFSPTVLSVPTLSENCYLSRRQFERKFFHYAGYSPKQYQKIARFNTVIKRFEKRPRTLSEMAVDCGYYDQSHFIHDFRLFSGYNPNTFFKFQKRAIDYRAFEEFSP